MTGIALHPNDSSLDATLGPPDIRLRGLQIVGETAIYRFPRRRRVRQSYRLGVRIRRVPRSMNQAVLTLSLRVHSRFFSSSIRGARRRIIVVPPQALEVHAGELLLCHLKGLTGIH